MDKSKLSIEKFRIEETKPLIEFWSNAFPNDPAHNAPAQMLKAKLVVDDLIYLAKYEGEIVGACMAGYDGHRGWLYAVATAKCHRRLGIGKQLVSHVVTQLKERGCIKLNLQIRADNTEVANFYRSLGFDIEERLSMGRFI